MKNEDQIDMKEERGHHQEIDIMNLQSLSILITVENLTGLDLENAHHHFQEIIIGQKINKSDMNLQKQNSASNLKISSKNSSHYSATMKFNNILKEMEFHSHISR
jgi:hypothetical protein